MSHKQIQEVFQYVSTHGSYLSSQKILKEVEKYPDTIWTIVVKLCSELKNSCIENAYAEMVFLLSDSQKHTHSVRWLKDFMYVYDLSLQMSCPYSIMDYIKPEKEKILVFLSKIVEVSKAIEGKKSELDTLIVRRQLVEQQYQKSKAKEQIVSFELQELRKRKERELPLFEEKQKAIAEKQQEISYKKQEKLNLVQCQNELRDEMVKKKKVLEEIKFQNDESELTIENLKKEIAINAPEIKKECRSAEEEFQALSQQYSQEKQTAKTKQRIVVNELEARKPYEKALKETGKEVNEKFEKLHSITARNKKLLQEKERLLQRLSQSENNEANKVDAIRVIETRTRTAEVHLHESRNEYHMEQISFDKKKEELKWAKRKNLNSQNKTKELKEYKDSLERDLEAMNSQYQERKQKLSKDHYEWKEMFNDSISAFYEEVRRKSEMMK